MQILLAVCTAQTKLINRFDGCENIVDQSNGAGLLSAGRDARPGIWLELVFPHSGVVFLTSVSLCVKCTRNYLSTGKCCTLLKAPRVINSYHYFIYCDVVKLLLVTVLVSVADR